MIEKILHFSFLWIRDLHSTFSHSIFLIPHSTFHTFHIPHCTSHIPHCASHMFHISQSSIAHFHIPLFFEFWRYNLCLFQLRYFLTACWFVWAFQEAAVSIQGENTKWLRQQASKYYGTVNPLPIMLGKVLGEPVRASQVMCVTSTITGKGKAIPWHYSLGWQIQQFYKRIMFNSHICITRRLCYITWPKKWYSLPPQNFLM